MWFCCFGRWYCAELGPHGSSGFIWVTLKGKGPGAFLAVQWLRLWAPDARGRGLISGQGTKCYMLVVKAPHKQAKKQNKTKIHLTACHPSLRARAPHGKGSHKWRQVSLCQQMLPVYMTVLAWISAGASIRGNCHSKMTLVTIHLSPLFSPLHWSSKSGGHQRL